ncbi:hypothetical protein D3C86_687650 [compost metagenome]
MDDERPLSRCQLLEGGLMPEGALASPDDEDVGLGGGPPGGDVGETIVIEHLMATPLEGPDDRAGGVALLGEPVHHVLLGQAFEAGNDVRQFGAPAVFRLHGLEGLEELSQGREIAVLPPREVSHHELGAEIARAASHAGDGRIDPGGACIQGGEAVREGQADVVVAMETQRVAQELSQVLEEGGHLVREAGSVGVDEVDHVNLVPDAFEPPEDGMVLRELGEVHEVDRDLEPHGFEAGGEGQPMVDLRRIDRHADHLDPSPAIVEQGAELAGLAFLGVEHDGEGLVGREVGGKALDGTERQELIFAAVAGTRRCAIADFHATDGQRREGLGVVFDQFGLEVPVGVVAAVAQRAIKNLHQTLSFQSAPAYPSPEGPKPLA